MGGAPVGRPESPMPLYFGAAVAAAALAHTTIAAFYFGSHLLGELVVLPSMKGANTNGDLAPLVALFKKLGPLFAGLGMGTLVTGLLYLFAKFGLDFGFILSFPEARTIVAALVLFLALLCIAIFIHQPIALRIIERDLGASPASDVSSEMRADIAKFAKVGNITSVGVVGVIVLMIAAANGGI